MEVGDVMIGQRERNRCYLELWDAFHLKGCPVCDCIGKRVMRRVRETLEGAPGKNALPLCVYHTRVLAAGHDECGSIAALRFIRRAEDWIRDSLERNKGGNGVLGLMKTAFAGRKAPCMETAPSKCFACRLERHQQRSILTVLVEALPDSDFHRAFQESDGLCVRHLCALSRRFSGKGAIDTVLQEQIRQLEELRDAFVPSRFQPDRAGIPADPVAWERLFTLLGEETGKIEDLEVKSILASGEEKCSPSDVSVVKEPDSVDDGPDAEPFEKAKWLRARDVLQRRLSEESSRAAALHYRYWKAMEDNKTLQMNLAGVQALVRSLQTQVDRLKEELALQRPQRVSR
jgi:hypothetical protein